MRICGLKSGFGSSTVLHGIDWEIPAGKTAVLLGSNGVGKTTFLKTLMGVMPTWAGKIEWQEQEIQSWPSEKRASAGLAYVPQGREIFPFLTVWENLILGWEARGHKVNPHSPPPEMVKVFEKFPILTPILKRRGGNLSGGQQQILALARVLLTSPQMLILDEPTEGIQPSIVDEIGEVLTGLREEGMTILLVEQFVHFALGLADTYAVMEHGALKQTGEVTEANRLEIESNVAI
jgi:urea transport system ATP-binding protein